MEEFSVCVGKCVVLRLRDLCGCDCSSARAGTDCWEIARPQQNAGHGAHY